MTFKTLFSAAAAFDAVRQLQGMPPGQDLQGHAFTARLRCEMADGWADFPGGEVTRLTQTLAARVGLLEQQLLNQRITDPSDEGIAHWVREGLTDHRLSQVRVGLQSSWNQGVELGPDAGLQVWRRYRFQSAHRLPHVPVGHKCGRMHGHGFEVILHADALHMPAGPARAAALDALWAPLHFELNYGCLNERPGLENPTSEVMSRWIWERLRPQLPALRGVTVYETASCGARFDGQNHRIWKDMTLDSSLYLKRAPAHSPLSRLHGHTYTLRLHLCAPLDPVLGWTVDFGEVKTLFMPVFKALDHQPLHEIGDLQDGDAASVASWILNKARHQLPQLDRVDLFETQGCGATVWTPSCTDPEVA
jgi:6-pyruvoyltetrahydropterin/6-carboxytetrahydropterin synthase